MTRKRRNRAQGVGALEQRVVAALQKLSMAETAPRPAQSAGKAARRRRQRQRKRAAVRGDGQSRPLVNSLGQAGSFAGTASQLTFSHEELWSEVKGSATAAVVKAYTFLPGKSGLGFLDKIALSWDRYVVTHVTIFYRSSSGTTRNGAVVVGVDWDVASGAGDLAYAQTLQPRLRLPVWESGQMVLPANLLMSRKFLLVSPNETAQINPDYGAFKVVAAVTSTSDASSIGELWVRYTVVFHSPTTEHVTKNR